MLFRPRLWLARAPTAARPAPTTVRRAGVTIARAAPLAAAGAGKIAATAPGLLSVMALRAMKLASPAAWLARSGATSASGGGAAVSPASMPWRRFADLAAKKQLGPVPGQFPPVKRAKQILGTYAQQSTYKKTPSGAPVEVDHMTPDSLHQPVGSSRKSGDGAALSKRLPAAAMNETQHRRKLTTGSSAAAQSFRAYLLHAHHGMVPFAGKMRTTQDHYAAAIELELRSTATESTLFGKPTLHDPRPFDKPSQKGVVPIQDAKWGMDRQLDMLKRLGSTGRIDATHVSHLVDVVTGQRAELADMYKKNGNRS